MVDLRAIQYALAVAKHVGRAADALFLTQPTLTRAIQDLEETLGTKLFDRGHRQVEPHSPGKNFSGPGRGESSGRSRT